MTRREMTNHVDAALAILNDVVGCHERCLAHALALSGEQWHTMRAILVVGGWVRRSGSLVIITDKGEQRAK